VAGLSLVDAARDTAEVSWPGYLAKSSFTPALAEVVGGSDLRATWRSTIPSVDVEQNRDDDSSCARLSRPKST
jgi:hypothetical protein